MIATKKFEDAVPPLETAVKLQPTNPATHYNLATAYSRTGKKAEADKEFAIHRQMTQKEPPPEDKAQRNPELTSGRDRMESRRTRVRTQ